MTTSKLNLRILFTLFIFVSLTITCQANTGTWQSSATSSALNFKVTESQKPLKDVVGKQITIVFLENLSVEKIGLNSNDADVQWLLAQGYRVVEIDYSHHELAISPTINKDIISINDQIAAGSFCGLNNCSQYQSYILFEGYRIQRNVPYFLDDPTVYNKPSQYTVGDSLYMDFVYPANPATEIPIVLSFSYSNSYATYDGDRQKMTDANKHQRLNLFNTLAGFNDSFLEGAPAVGVAWAIADHPKYCPWGGGKPTGGTNDTYKSYQANPDAGQKVKSAVRTLRVKVEELGLSGEIGIYGFSRGSDAGSMVVGTKDDPIYDEAGFNQGVSDSVQVAILGPGVFDYTQIYNTIDDGDGNLELRCPWAWGPLADNFEVWKSKGAEYFIESKESAPVLFFYNKDDSHYYQDQIANLQHKLQSLGVEIDSIVNHGSGHSVPQDSENLQKMYDFLLKHFNTTSNGTGLNEIQIQNDQTIHGIKVAWLHDLEESFQIQFELVKPLQLRFELFSMNGVMVFQFQKNYEMAGAITEVVPFSMSNQPIGLYNLRLTSKTTSSTVSFMKSNS